MSGQPPLEPPAGPPEQPEEPAPEPADDTPWRHVPPPPERHGSVWLGILVGVVALAAVVALLVVLASALPAAWTALVLVLPLAYLAGSIVLASRSRTARFGAGLLIAIGVSVLLAAGICTAAVFSGRSIA